MKLRKQILGMILGIICRYTRNFKNIRGTYRLIDWLRTHPNLFNGISKKGCKIKDVGIMELNPREYIDNLIFIYGEYEYNLVKLMKTILSEGDGVLDIGSNIGYFTLVASGLVKENGTVYSFEAATTTFKCLKRNVCLNDRKNIKLYNHAISDKYEKAKFNIQREGNSGMSSLRNLEGMCSESITVETKPIDSFVNEMMKIKLIKMDIEGAEDRAIVGMEKLIERDRPYIISEISDEYLLQLGSCGKKLIQRLQKIGYNLYFTDKPQRRLLETPEEQCNILCIPHEIDNTSDSQNISALIM